MSELRERFRTAGHTSTQTLDAMLPEEKFLPIQKVVDTKDNTTVGYLFREVEYKQGHVQDIILSEGWLRLNNKSLLTETYHDWQGYEQDSRNTLGWVIPSGPITLELIFRSQHDNSTLGREVQQRWRHSYNIDKYCQTTSTVISCRNGIALISHNWTEEPLKATTPEESLTTITKANNPLLNQFLRALFGKRYTQIDEIFGQYGTPISLSTEQEGTDVLTLEVSYLDKFCIRTTDIINDQRPALGVTMAKNILSNPRYEVRDE